MADWPFATAAPAFGPKSRKPMRCDCSPDKSGERLNALVDLNLEFGVMKKRQTRTRWSGSGRDPLVN
ncbi:hypothetical protein [Pseudorhodoplanes sinuspersici]|uniref:Uncharacterized protein n=1 Tax=Pseudorhodoplanes sinuspersici TaxID=1235591 RepID=A0A1W6ZJY8_9HYPH|nr:hypothetical protein [Pseudorhodoplanes sinuspersici]ARP97642.1 hypothetical protein CAK95_00045 [Pseudorhodoplanes sinuspersici]